MSQVHQTIVFTPPQSQALPALVNAFCWPGLGQLIQGRLVAAVIWYFTSLVAALLIFVGIGLCLYPLVWLACILDAAWYKPNYGPNKPSGVGIVAVALGAIGLMAGVLVIGFALSAASTIRLPNAPTAAPSVVAEKADTEDTGLIDDGGNIAVGPTHDEPPEEDAESTAEVLDSVEPPETPAPADEDLRTWTDASGGHTIEAKFIKLTAGVVTLEKPDGSRIEIESSKLSEEDRDWIRRRGRR